MIQVWLNQIQNVISRTWMVAALAFSLNIIFVLLYMVNTYLHEWCSTIVVTEISLSIVCQEEFYNVLLTLSTGKVKSRSKKKKSNFKCEPSLQYCTLEKVITGGGKPYVHMYNYLKRARFALDFGNVTCTRVMIKKKIPFCSPFGNCKMQKWQWKRFLLQSNQILFV